ncbi:hypothetical protein HUN33_18365 [Acinetobacter bereziniae]|uniref:hypothetical protein n=1 Tax=Acinetobacter bereziniae TaxID=106648 RepID=UPI001580A879|nr:hypothetical protein [Acinetobacter bereziniae]MBO3656441.1 hypothetical protein [Acinetobacter bereziniae]NUF65583.1 hypothetical protein [Acinetobacter bereziniae]NUG08458.1 hypothetical protein [Acinetobacter bereziniae]NUG71952.1 hypothetical protein [Acinetobacter bereziniae]NUG81981.1 hypothetical protein [Acinetobacter bereziniae]
MKILVLSLISAILIIGFIILRRKKSKQNNLKDLVKKTFPKHIIIEKFGTVMICEINHRNEPDELVFIRINPSKKKKINKTGRRLNAEYPAIPTAKELKMDFGNHLR